MLNEIDELFSLMKLEGWDETKLATKSGVNVSHIISWFSGKSRPSSEDLDFCLKALGYERAIVKKSLSKPILTSSIYSSAITQEQIHSEEYMLLRRQYLLSRGLVVKLYNKLKYAGFDKDGQLEEAEGFMRQDYLYERVLIE